MAIISVLPAQHIIDGYRGVLDFYVLCRGGAAKTVCVRKWPVTPKTSLSKGTVAAQKPFAIAAAAIPKVSQDMKDIYSEMAGGTSYTWKDVAMTLYLNGAKTYREFE